MTTKCIIETLNKIKVIKIFNKYIFIADHIERVRGLNVRDHWSRL